MRVVASAITALSIASGGAAEPVRFDWTGSVTFADPDPLDPLVVIGLETLTLTPRAVPMLPPWGFATIFVSVLVARPWRRRCDGR